VSAASGEDRRKVFASVEAIGRIGERWSEYIRRRERRLVLARSLIFGGLVFFVLTSVVVAYLVSQYDWAYFVAHRDQYVPYFGLSILLGMATLVASYIVLRRRTESKFRELSDLIGQLKADKEGHEEAWKALAATRKMLEVLPEVARPRTTDALVYGLIAFVLAAVVAKAPIGLLAGIAVFLYFRYEGRRTYETELSRLEEQRKVFEERMQSFAQSL